MYPKFFSLAFLIAICLIPSSDQLNVDNCQCRRSSRQRIVGGKAVGNENIPWLASLGNRLSNVYEDNPARLLSNPYLQQVAPQFKVGVHRCAAIIVNENWIMTSAHCAQRHPNKFAVALGKNQDLVEMFDGGRIHVETVIRHPNFSESKHEYFNDIALMKLARPIAFDNINTSAACFNFDSWVNSESPLTLFGWGAKTPSTIIKGLWEHNENSQNLQELQLQESSKIDDLCSNRSDIICASPIGETAWNQGACKGDDGSAVHKMINGKMAVVGLHSYSSIQEVNGEKSLCQGPLAITRLDVNKEWIQNIVGDMCVC